MTQEQCFICGYNATHNLEAHHIVPNRFGGTDSDENMVNLCPNCHRAVEKLYNKRFYQKIGVYSQYEELETDDPILEPVRNIVQVIARSYRGRNNVLLQDGKQLIHVVLSQFGMEGQYCYSFETVFKTRFDSDAECPNCKGVGFNEVEIQ